MKKFWTRITVYFLSICLILSQALFVNTVKADTSNTAVVLSNAKFQGLTQIEVDTNAQLTGITKENIVITGGERTISSDSILGVEVEANKILVNLDANAFNPDESNSATIATKSFGNFGASTPVNVIPSSEGLDSVSWKKITSKYASADSTWHNIRTKTPVITNPQEYPGYGQGTATTYKQTGKVKALMVVVDFPDAKAADNTGKNSLPDETPVDFGNTVHGHVLKTAQDYYDFVVPGANKFYNTSSYGNLGLDVTLVKNPGSSDGVFTCEGLLYGGSSPYSNSYRGGDHDSYVKDALSVARPALSSYPGNYDLLYVVTVENAVGISKSSTDTTNAAANVDLWSGRSDLKTLVRLGDDMYSSWKYKDMDHETAHALGLVDYNPNNYSGYGGGQCDPNTGTIDYSSLVGHWDLMGYINGPAPDFLAWDKWKFGWIRDEQVDIIKTQGSTTHQITPVETPGGTKMVVIEGAPSGTAYVIENRQALGVDDTANTEKSTDPDPNNQNNNWAHNYGKFNTPGILMYKVDCYNGAITVVDLYPDNTTTELGTMLDKSVLGASSGIFSYTDPASGINVQLDKESTNADTVTVNYNPSAAVKTVLSDAHFIDANTIECKTNIDLRGIPAYDAQVKIANPNPEGDPEKNYFQGTTINQMTPKTLRITFNNYQIINSKDENGIKLSTGAFSFNGASDEVSMVPFKCKAGPVLRDAKFNSLTQLQVNCYNLAIDPSNIGVYKIIIKKADGSILFGGSDITDVKFDAASNLLNISLGESAFLDEGETKGVTIAISAISDYKPDGHNIVQARYNPPINVVDESTPVSIEPYTVPADDSNTTSTDSNIEQNDGGTTTTYTVNDDSDPDSDNEDDQELADADTGDTGDTADTTDNQNPTPKKKVIIRHIKKPANNQNDDDDSQNQNLFSQKKVLIPTIVLAVLAVGAVVFIFIRRKNRKKIVSGKDSKDSVETTKK